MNVTISSEVDSYIHQLTRIITKNSVIYVTFMKQDDMEKAINLVSVWKGDVAAERLGRNSIPNLRKVYYLFHVQKLNDVERY